MSVGIGGAGTVDHSGTDPWAMVVLVACTPLGWALARVGWWFMVTFSLSPTNWAFSQRCTTLATGQGAHAVLVEWLISRPHCVGLWVARFARAQVGVCRSQYGAMWFAYGSVPRNRDQARHALILS